MDVISAIGRHTDGTELADFRLYQAVKTRHATGMDSL